jgi:pyruvate formate-lyase activating enzyme-like uncharacterized protein
MKRNNLLYRSNPLFALLKLYMWVRSKEFLAEARFKKKILSCSRFMLGSASAAFPLLLGIKPHFKWFSARAAREASKTRDDLLDQLSGRVGSTAEGSKLYTGSLSGGCLHCIEGDWACNFINRLCNRECFFCKRSHRVIREEPEAETWGFFFPDPRAHISYLKKFNIGGVSFSGGEPLLVRERLLEHISAVRKEFRDSVYIWMYTNGDLVNRKILEELRGAGLKEIRFNIAAREYDLAPAILAKEFIPVVTVEIPCIPDEYERLKTLLPVMQGAGIDFLNIHQLTVEEQNCRDLVRRAYHFTGLDSGISVYESEISALRLLLHACNKGISLPINYCSSIYKQRFQGRGFRKQRACAFPLAYEELTDTAYLRRISVSAPREKIREMESKLMKNSPEGLLWKTSRNEDQIILHSSLVSNIDWADSTVEITYLKPGVSPGEGSDLLEADNLKENKTIVFKTSGLDKILFDLWFSLYIKKENPGTAGVGEAGTAGQGQRQLQDEIFKINPYEIQEQGFPEII